MHVHATGTPVPAGRRVRAILAAITLPLLVATLVGLVALWPRGENPMGSLPLGATGATLDSARVTEIVPIGGGETVDPFLGADVSAELLSGIGAGTVVPVQVPGEILVNGMDVGDTITVLFTPDAMGTGSPYVFYDFEREVPIGILLILYLVVVVAVARWKGLAAVLGLGASMAVTGVFVLPAIMAGMPPMLVVLVGSSAMMFLAVYLAHGISVRSTTALLGTFAGLAIMVVLGYISIDGANLTGAQSDTSLILSTSFPGLSLRDVLLCGLVIAGLGALNDVTITQASAVWEIHAANPQLSKRRLWAGGMRIGRDHIASTIYTLAFAYVGSALPMLLVGALIDRSVIDFLLAGEVAEEVVRTLVSSIGLILAIPMTTGLAVMLVGTSRPGLKAAAAAGDGAAAVPADATASLASGEATADPGPAVVQAQAPAGASPDVVPSREDQGEDGPPATSEASESDAGTGRRPSHPRYKSVWEAIEAGEDEW